MFPFCRDSDDTPHPDSRGKYEFGMTTSGRIYTGDVFPKKKSRVPGSDIQIAWFSEIDRTNSLSLTAMILILYRSMNADCGWPIHKHLRTIGTCGKRTHGRCRFHREDGFGTIDILFYKGGDHNSQQYDQSVRLVVIL